MALFPQFQGPDAIFRQNLYLTTTLSERFLTGTLPADTVDLQVSVRGASFSSDPDLITFEGTEFTLPNPSAFPDGLQLLPGLNEIKVKAILSTGSVTQEALAVLTLVLESDVGGILDAPTGVTLERLDSSVKVSVEGLDNPLVAGYHIYASPQPGGGEVGYFRINPAMLISGEPQQVEGDLATLTVDAEIETDEEGFPMADPLYFRLQGIQEDQDDTILATNFNEVLEVPETVTRLRIETTVKSVRENSYFSFEHDRQATLNSPLPALPHTALSTVPDSEPLYYVVTAIHLIDGIEHESHFSPEVVGSPLRITPSVGTFPQVSRQAMVRDFVQSIYRTHPAVRVDPGSALRDTVIDPFTTEADRIRFIIDFLHNAQSFATLLVIDDPNLSGESISVAQSGYKTALRAAFHLSSNDAVQTLIDNAFDKLASNYGVVRDQGKRARGEVTFFVTSRPVSVITRAIGTRVQGGGVTFHTTSTALISPVSGGKGYNFKTGRYLGKAFIQADQPGSAGNLAPFQINTLSNHTLNVQVTNEARTFGGTDRQSNRDLALTALRTLAAVDSGTLQGYVANAIKTPGVAQARVVDSGHPLMQRDRNAEGRHLGGKVDVYIRGMSEARVTDAFAFKFTTRTHQQFEPVGDLTDMRFRAVDPALTLENPLIEMLELPNLDIVFENVSKGYAFDLTDVEIVAYNQIVLSADYNDPLNHDLEDEIRGSYRYRTSDRFVLTRQPVIEITSLTGARTGLVSADIYKLFRADDPLGLGRSMLAGDYLQVTEPLDEEGTTIPSSDPLEVTGEEHVILSGVEFLNRLGANPLTVRVWNQTRSVEYNGPYSTGDRDFTFVDGDEVTPLGFQVTDESRISEGQTVLVDYFHDENFVVEYRSNAVVAAVQDVFTTRSHLAADVLAKWAVEVPVDITATVALGKNASRSAVDSRIRTALARLFGTLGLGSPVRQSDVIRAIDEVDGVSYVVTPLTRLTRGDGALVTRERLLTDTTSDFVWLPLWSSPTVDIYLLKQALNAATLSAGGPRHEFRGVFQDESRLKHHESPPNIHGFPLRGSSEGAFIIGYSGLNIPGYSDNATIETAHVLPSDPDEKATEILRIRREMTANRVLVSFVAGSDTPLAHDYAVTYVVSGDTGVKNIESGPVEYLVLGNLNFVYDEAE